MPVNNKEITFEMTFPPLPDLPSWGDFPTYNKEDYVKDITVVFFSKSKLRKLNPRQLKKITDKRIKNKENIQEFKNCYPVNVGQINDNNGKVNLIMEFIHQNS